MTRALPAQTADAVIIEQSWREPERFSAISDRYYTEIHRYATRRLGTGLADDVAAETFLIVFDKRTGYDISRDDAWPWLYGIASNVIARHRRTEVRQYRALAMAASAVVITTMTTLVQTTGGGSLRSPPPTRRWCLPRSRRPYGTRPSRRPATISESTPRTGGRACVITRASTSPRRRRC
ncbi:RNA polymerase sigma factor [Streptosporangium sp. NPDC004631]